MNKGLLFFICSTIILVLTAINLSVGPIISKKVGTDWGTRNCEYIADLLEDEKGSQTAKELKYGFEWVKNECYHKRGMYNLEYTSFIFNIVIGFVCSLLGLLHILDVKTDFAPKMGLIGLICGIVGFVLSLVYVIYNGIVYTNYYDDDDIYKTDSFGIFAQRNGDKFECFYHDEPENRHSIIAKYSDLGKKQYNYNKDLIASYSAIAGSTSSTGCKADPKICLKGKEITYSYDCNYLYVPSAPTDSISNKDKSDRFLTALILSLFVCLANIGIALFGFLLFKSPSEPSVAKFETLKS